ncbi:HIT family protein [Candidatus Wolfebacteria bacterium]|nr:HIT family protein [Candidatus Wolfebacteria bacterium]
MNEDTIFEKILKGEIPAHKVYENEYTFAFLDIAPINKGHTLVIPKLPTRNILSVDQKTFGHVMETVRFLAPKIKEATGADGINIGINNEPAAGQVVFHLHVHIMPRFIGDGKKLWPGKEYLAGEADIVLNSIKKLL